MKQHYRSLDKGFSLIELIIGIALSGIILLGSIELLKVSGDFQSLMGSILDRSTTLHQFRTTLKRSFIYRTQMDLATGAGIYNGVLSGDTLNPLQLSIRSRSAKDPKIIGLTRFRTVCMKSNVKGVTQKPLPEGFCSAALPRCGEKHRLIIEVATFANEQDAKKPTKLLTFPNPSGAGADSTIGGALCINEASNDRITAKVAFEIKLPNNTSRWSVSSFDLWDDMGRLGFEYLN